jgi:hypothetical protein
MESAIQFFRYQEQVWQVKQKHLDSWSFPGHAAWAARQDAMWCSLAIQAESKFAA